MKNKSTGQISAKTSEIEALKKTSDSEVDFSDIPLQGPERPEVEERGCRHVLSSCQGTDLTASRRGRHCVAEVAGHRLSVAHQRDSAARDEPEALNRRLGRITAALHAEVLMRQPVPSLMEV